MAQIELTLYHVACYGLAEQESSVTNLDVTVASEIKTLENPSEPEAKSIYLKVGDDITQYSLYLVTISFLKKVYQPTEVIAELQVKGGAAIPMSVLEKTFKHVKVELKCDSAAVGSDYYVHEVQARYKKDGMYVSLKIYSLDKLLTINKVSRAFVAQKLADKTKSILSTEMAKYKKPYFIDNSSSESKTVGYDATNMQHLTDGSKEHIHPYLVQYNESFYDLLARTANRWGEFMYYEDGQLNFGYNKASTPTEVNNYTERYYFDIYHADNGKNPSVATDGNYDVLASNEKQFIDTTLEKSPNSISGIMYSPGDKFDKVVMKKLANFFKNDKSLPAFIVNEIVDDIIEIGSKAVQRDHANEKFDQTYFPEDEDDNGKMVVSSSAPGLAEQRDGDNKTYNQFTEIGTNYNDTKYLEILAKEQTSGRNALHMNFDTTYPNLTLGQMIEVDGQYYIVVEVSCRKMTSVDYSLDEQKDAEGNIKIAGIKKITTFNYVFEVVALGGNAKTASNAKEFYPAVIPAGHIRLAEPQIATISDAKDPSGNNQVRVVFPWQYDENSKVEGVPKSVDDAAKQATPWLRFTTNASGAPIVGKHYKGNKVLIGFINGNVERPYVLGCLESKGDKADVAQTSPGGHYLKINDDPSGLSKFLTGMFLPGWKSLSAFVPQMGELPETEGDTGIKLGGGFELSDYYGIYRISGSTDGRNVTVASPWGNVVVNAFTGISISAPNGDISIRGKNVSIEAGNNLTLTSGTNVKAKIIDGTVKGSFSNLGGEIAAAVVKKLADTLLNLVTIDLTIVRNVFDIVFRPAEGKLLVKSNRYLMLESGKGQCAYPEAAYVDKNMTDFMIEKRKKKDLRPGLEISGDMVKVANKIGNLVDIYNSKYIKAYNECFEKKEAFDKSITKARGLADDFDGTNTPVICKSFADLKDKFWENTNKYFRKEDLEFKDNFKDDSVADALLTITGLDITTAEKKEKVKKKVLELRKDAKKEVGMAADELRKSIMAFNMVLNGLTGDEVKKEVESLRHFYFPNYLLDALEPAFKKEKLGDDCYYCTIEDAKKDLTTALGANDLDAHKKILKRKAAILWLEKLGFQDEWRKEVPNRDESGAQVATTDAEGKPIPGTTSKPARPFAVTDIGNDTKWADYLNSLTAVPKLSPVKYKAAEALKKSAEKWVDNLYFFKNIVENESWSNAKNGGILFSSDEHTYGLQNTIKTDIKTIAKEKLTELDDPTVGVTSFLDTIRNVLKDF